MWKNTFSIPKKSYPVLKGKYNKYAHTFLNILISYEYQEIIKNAHFQKPQIIPFAWDKLSHWSIQNFNKLTSQSQLSFYCDKF